jgi:hypothetical protein
MKTAKDRAYDATDAHLAASRRTLPGRCFAALNMRTFVIALVTALL